MHRVTRSILAPVIAVVALLLGAAPAAAGVSAGIVSAGVDDFTFASFDAQYHLGTDEEGHSTLRTVETLVAEFPETDQNRGIRRSLPERYDGHPTDLEIVSVTDERGEPRDYEVDSEDDVASVTIAADDYVHGAQTYVIEYEQRHVTRYYDDTGRDEFYWDVNGLDWAQPFAVVTATVHLEDGLEEGLTGDVSAVAGSEGSTAEVRSDGLSFEARDLAPHQTMSIAIGFEPGTFVPRDGSFFAAPWPTIGVIGTLGALAALVWGFIVRFRSLRDAPGRGIIVPEYAPPRGVSLLTSAAIAGRSAKSTPAQIIDLAVTRNLRVVETGEKGLLKKPQYRLEFLTVEGVNEHEREFLHGLFGSVLTPGEHRDLEKHDAKATKRLTELHSAVSKQLTEEGYRRKYPSGAAAPVFIAASLAMAAGAIFSGVALDQAYGGVIPGITLVASIVFGVAAMIPLMRIPLTERGVGVRDHMRGLKDYIELAEADRLRYLQSPKGALREPIATDDAAQVVKLNEKLLPYAMLFGHEKEWAEELGRYYEQHDTRPDWYVGVGPFNAAVFAASIGAVSTSSSAAYTASSSSGGSGGASAGGGGGGGGGGGV